MELESNYRYGTCESCGKQVKFWRDHIYEIDDTPDRPDPHKCNLE